MFTLLSWTGINVSILYHLLNFSRKSKATNFFRSSSLRAIILNVLTKPTFKVNLKCRNTVSNQKQLCHTHFIWAVCLTQQNYQKKYLALLNNWAYRQSHGISSPNTNLSTPHKMFFYYQTSLLYYNCFLILTINHLQLCLYRQSTYSLTIIVSP